MADTGKTDRWHLHLVRMGMLGGTRAHWCDGECDELGLQDEAA